jgi:hypothetical protein
VTRVYFDSETFSEVDLEVVGAYAYADHPSTEVILATYAIGDGPVRRWSPAEGEPIPADLLAVLRNPSLITAHNSAFDRNVVPRALYRMGILTAAERDRLLTPAVWRCTMVKALAHALPGDLDTLGRVLGLREDQAKITEGKKLIQRFCKPAPANHKRRRYDHTTHPELWARFVRYAEMDIVAMRECDRRMPDWNLGPREHALWLLDQQINDRGFYCDRELVDAAVRTTEEEKRQMATRFAELTGGCVAKATQRDQFRAFLKEHHGLELENTQAETLRTVRKRVPDDSDLAELLDIALATNKTSTSKYARIQPAIGADGRFRGGLQFAGAGRTRRWGGRMFQPQNLPSRGLPKAKLVDAYIAAVKAEVHTVCFDNLMWYGSAALRGVVTAPPGRHIVAADLSNIEGRMLAWVAREEWKLEAFRAYDAGTGPDLYNITANMIIGVDPWNVPKKVRNVFGKVPDLACFAEDTPVLTDRGLKRIVDVQPDDRVWDGVEWVNHQGVVARSVRQVVSVAGIEVTPDHLIRTGRTWTPAGVLATCENTLSQALATASASLPWSAFGEAPAAGSVRFSPDAHAETMWRSWRRICDTVEQRVATGAQSRKPPTHESTTGVTWTSSLTTVTDGGCSTESHPVSTDAETLTTRPIPTTEGEASGSGLLGSPTGGLSSRTSSPWKAGIAQTWSWIVSTLTEVTNRTTFASSPNRPTSTTDVASSNFKLESPSLKPVFDIALAGPRNRFTILTEKGWLLVHNCGYQGGVAGFQNFAHAYGVRMADHWDTIQQSIDPAIIAKARKNLAKGWAKKQIADLEISELEWLASEACKLAWRARHPATVTFWYALQEAAIKAIEFPGSVHEVTCLKLSCREHAGHLWLQILLPSGNRLCYFHPHIIKAEEYDEERDELRVRKSLAYWALSSEEGGPRIWQRTFTHGGKLTGNVCQTLARDVLAYNMPAIEQAGYDIVMTVHDEVVAEAPVSLNEDRMVELLATDPPWATGLPLAAAGFHHDRYMKED